MDELGRKWKYQPGTLPGGFGFYVDGTLETPDKFDQFEFPDPLAPGRCDDFVTALKAMGDDYPVMGVIGDGIFHRAQEMVGPKEFLLYMYENPGFVRKVLESNYKFSLELGKAYLDAGAEFILIGGDLGDNHGPFMSPTLRRAGSPLLQKPRPKPEEERSQNDSTQRRKSHPDNRIPSR